MKKGIKFVVIILCLSLLSMVFAEEELTDENMYGMPLAYIVSPAYPGDISVDGLYISQDDNDYIFTVIYSNGTLAQYKDLSKTLFNSAGQDETIRIGYFDNSERIKENGNVIEYHVQKALVKKVKHYTIFMFDTKHDDQDENITVEFRTDDLDYDGIPDVNSMYSGYKQVTDKLKTTISIEPSSWAKKHIEELQLEGLLRESAFESFTDGITRERFVYLMVSLYEELTESQITIDSAISFDDSDDIYVLKAATIGITTGIGDNKFGPDIILNREQMTTFLIKTLNLANIEMTTDEEAVNFADDEDISDWAKSFVYTAKKNGIMGGTGNNNFLPKGEATNEQALYITHGLLEKHGSLEWFKAFEGSRLYLKKDGELYHLSLIGDITVSNSDTDVKLYINLIEDTQKVINALLLQTKDMTYATSTNPNIKGNLKEYDYKKIKVTAENLYSGVDKNGEKTIIDVDNDKFKAEVSQNLEGLNHTIKNFDKVKFYDFDDARAETHILPLDKIAEALGIDYKITYDIIWDIYVIERVEE